MVKETKIEEETQETEIRKLATLVKVENIRPIIFTNKETGEDEMANAIEMADARGWHVVVGKNEFKNGDWAVYFEPDSILPRESWSEFLVDENRPDKPLRIKTKRVLGHVSQGLAIPLNKIFSDIETNEETLLLKETLTFSYKNKDYRFSLEDEDNHLTSILNIKKYEPTERNRSLFGVRKNNFPSFLRKTDSERIQNNFKQVSKYFGEKWYATVKCDGTSATYYLNENGFGVCSRNMELKESENSLYWQTAKKYDLENKLKKFYEETGNYICVQGEIVGPRIQGNGMKLEKTEFHVFDIYDIKTGNYYDFVNLMVIGRGLGLKMVTVLDTYENMYEFNSVDSLVELATRKDPLGKYGWIEGLVFRPKRYIVDDRIGRVAFKTVNPIWLLRNDG